MTQRTYYEDDSPTWEWWGAPQVALPEDRSHLEVRHGYTLDDIDHCARIALVRCHGMFRLSRTDRYEIAYSAVTLALLEADEPPEPKDLAAAAQHAITSQYRADLRHHGQHETFEQATRKAFTVYWESASRARTPMEDRVLERIALTQIWPHLTPRQRQSIAALAAAGNQGAAAESLGLPRTAVNVYITQGRQRAYRLWFDHEPPPRLTRDQRVSSYSRPLPTHCKNGHPYTEDNTRIRRSQGREYRQCVTCPCPGHSHPNQPHRPPRHCWTSSTSTHHPTSACCNDPVIAMTTHE